MYTHIYGEGSSATTSSSVSCARTASSTFSSALAAQVSEGMCWVWGVSALQNNAWTINPRF